MTPLRKRMIEDMKLFGYSKRTQETYLYSVSRLAQFFKKSPDKISNEELRQYLLYHKDRYARNTTTIALCGIKFLFQKTLKRKMPVFNLIRQSKENKLPVVFTREEVHLILSNVRVLRHRTCLTVPFRLFSVNPCWKSASKKISISIPCATPMPLIFWRRASISASFHNISAINPWRVLSFIPISHLLSKRESMTKSITL